MTGEKTNQVLEGNKFLKFGLAFVPVLIVSVIAASCGERSFRLTKEQVEEGIRNELPNGATQEQVKRFIASFKSEFKVDERDNEAIPLVTPEASALNTLDSSYRGLIRARIREVGRDPKNFALFDLHLEFYFDEKGLLAGNKVKTVGYH